MGNFLHKLNTFSSVAFLVNTFTSVFLAKSSRISAIKLAIKVNSSSLKPLVVAAAVPSLMPEVINGLESSKGMPFLLQVNPTFSRDSSASFPVIPCFLKSTSKRWVSVPPVITL